MSLDLTYHKSTVVQVMAWGRQATNNYLSQYWLSPMSPHSINRPQLAKMPHKVYPVEHAQVFIGIYSVIIIYIMLLVPGFIMWVIYPCTSVSHRYHCANVKGKNDRHPITTKLSCMIFWININSQHLSGNYQCRITINHINFLPDAHRISCSLCGWNTDFINKLICG